MAETRPQIYNFQLKYEMDFSLKSNGISFEQKNEWFLFVFGFIENLRFTWEVEIMETHKVYWYSMMMWKIQQLYLVTCPERNVHQWLSSNRITCFCSIHQNEFFDFCFDRGVKICTKSAIYLLKFYFEQQKYRNEYLLVWRNSCVVNCVCVNVFSILSMSNEDEAINNPKVNIETKKSTGIR